MRRELESAVVGVNKHLKDVVANMSWITLLRNCHPIYRKDYARVLHRNGQITDSTLAELTTIER